MQLSECLPVIATITASITYVNPVSCTLFSRSFSVINTGKTGSPNVQKKQHKVVIYDINK